MEISNNQIAEMRVTFKEKLLDFMDSVFGPLVYLLAVILRVKTGYQKGETLILKEAIGKEDSPKYIPVDSEVTFFKASDIEGELDPLIAVNYDSRVILVKEVDVKIKSWLKRKMISYEFNFKMMRGNKRLRKYHPFLIPRLFYKAVYFIVDLFKKKEK